ncbi:serine/threonine protein kinase [Beauveria brongniartii RCEF 3172]|uniref:Altered inheritance of mitochondria protein 9, mitochondrial n=1 Tax=Beauveria brongniartii RCEF 3172 TaxID=1081107 RepID=A0A167C5Q2_9HYPO|nr:serine/threonine protein kinase [Beauveria brongniartii RCEF 3172]
MRLIKASQQVMRMLVEDARVQGAAAPTLLHPDFHIRNIFVSADDPTIITGLIDWQSTSVEPAFIYANETPDFATPPEEPEEEMPESGQSEQKSPEMRERERKDALICYQTYNVCMKGLVPKVREARPLDPSLFRVFQYCHMSWRDSAAALHQELIELSARWTELGLQGACPFSPTEQELKEHAQNYEDFETVQRLKLWLKSALHTDSDGWVSNAQWDAARDAHRAVYDQWIETARESESDSEGLTVEKADKLWPFDAR